MTDKLLYSFEEAHQALGISRRTLYRRIESGEIPKPLQWHGKPYFRVADLQAVVDRISKGEGA